MKSQLLKVFITCILLITLAVIETYTTGLINEHDDLISGLGLILSVGFILLGVYGIYKTWFNKLKQKK